MKKERGEVERRAGRDQVARGEGRKGGRDGTKERGREGGREGGKVACTLCYILPNGSGCVGGPSTIRHVLRVISYLMAAAVLVAPLLYGMYIVLYLT